MKKISSRIVFFGSGYVAAEALSLIASEFDVEAVITKPKPTDHRGSMPVLDVVNDLGLNFYEVANKQELSQLVEKIKPTSRIGVLIDFGIIINEDVINYFPLGIVNSHFSLLPGWRGPDPITWAILSGQEFTGVSLMLLSKGIDEGPIIAQQKISISKLDNTETLTDKLIRLSQSMLVKNLPKYIAGDIKPQTQSTKSEVTYSRKISKEDGVIDWHKSAEQLEREIRAFADWPKSHTELFGKPVILTSAAVSDLSLKPGEIVVDNHQIFVGTSIGSLIVKNIKPIGKLEMSSTAFLAGYRK
ncbi:MAG TPA: methionyl-tRNA formyltransferase [Candidatus Saccharimonadales bacterium]|nr:methionyl-tRNA formyltransferase [Candidatus Saccharimonadales bacterium]